MIKIAVTYLIVPTLIMNIITLNLKDKHASLSLCHEKEITASREEKMQRIRTKPSNISQLQKEGKQVQHNLNHTENIDNQGVGNTQDNWGENDKEEEKYQGEAKQQEVNGKKEDDEKNKKDLEGSENQSKEIKEQEVETTQEEDGVVEEDHNEEANQQGEDKSKEITQEALKDYEEEEIKEEDEVEEKQEKDKDNNKDKLQEKDKDNNKDKLQEEDTIEEQEKQEEKGQEDEQEKQQGDGADEGAIEEESQEDIKNGEGNIVDENQSVGNEDNEGEQQTILPSTISESYTLQEDCIVTENLYLKNGTLDLNGYTLTIDKNLYHEGGELKVNNGKLIIKGNYNLCRVSEKLGNEEIIRGEGKLSLTNSSEVLDIGEDFIIKTNNYMRGDLKEATIYLGGDFFYSPQSIKYALELPESLKLILVGEGAIQTITDTINECKLGTLIIRGNANRAIHFNVDYSRITIYNLKVESPVQFMTSKQNEFYLSNIVAYEDILINGDVQTAYTCDMIENKLTINGDFSNLQGVYLKKAKLEVNGDWLMKYNANLYMNDSESEIFVRGNLKIASTKKIGLTAGKISIGKDLIRTEKLGSFITDQAVEVILLGDIEEGEYIEVQGSGIMLGKVYIEGIEKYKFSESVQYNLVNLI